MFNLLICAASTFGIATLVAEYDGPNHIFLKAREKYEIFRCNVCLSVWLGLPAAYLTHVGIGGYFATIGLVIAMERLT